MTKSAIFPAPHKVSLVWKYHWFCPFFANKPPETFCSRFLAGPSLMHHMVCVFARLFWNYNLIKTLKTNTPSKICLPYCANSLSFACHILKTKNMLWIFHFGWITMFSDGLIQLKIFLKIKKKSNLHLKIYPNVLRYKVNNPQLTNNFHIKVNSNSLKALFID